MSSINASTSPAAIIQTADGTGILALQTGNTTALTIDASQNVGIGTGATTQLYADYTQLGIKGKTTVAGGTLQFTTSNGTIATNLVCDTNATYLAAVGGSGLAFAVGGSGTGTERMRIDSSGRVGINTASPTAMLHINSDSDSITPSRFNVTTTGAASKNCVIFQREGTNVGFITVTNAATAYATSSDYRLKENIVPMTGALATVTQLKPVTYKWKIDGSDGQGFIAHELQAVVPDAVVGEKDALDTEGNPEYQGVDTSFLVATLTAAIQEQQQIITDLKATVDLQVATINDLKTRVETLEAK